MSSFVDYSKTSNTQIAINFHQKIIVDYFAGGGGASTGLELGLNISVYAAVNHNPKTVLLKQQHVSYKTYLVR